MTVEVFDKRACKLGEGPLWHPLRKQFFWFDILGKRLMTQVDGQPHHWQFDEYVSAAGWVDINTLLIASESELFRFDLETGARQSLVPLEADIKHTRSNDGRADPWGGFWIGTMGINAEVGAGAIYRFYRGALQKIISPLTITNSIAFSPDKAFAYYADTRDHRIMRQPLSPSDGWPVAAPEVFVDLAAEALNPDGSVVDSEGCLWNAQWGANRVARYAPDGHFVSAVTLPAKQTSCPAFGGGNLQTLFVTTAAIGLAGKEEGLTYRSDVGISGQEEHQVVLDG